MISLTKAWLGFFSLKAVPEELQDLGFWALPACLGNVAGQGAHIRSADSPLVILCLEQQLRSLTVPGGQQRAL